MVLLEKTNTPMPRKNEKEHVISYLKDITNQTHDYNLRYDLKKCIDILEGKELEDVKELKEALQEALCENEELYAERVELVLENEVFKGKL